MTADVHADRIYWQELADALGWRLHGYTYRLHASYFTSKVGYIQIHKWERDAIMDAIGRARMNNGNGQHTGSV